MVEDFLQIWQECDGRWSAVAEKMGMTVAGLQRKLASQGFCYETKIIITVWGGGKRKTSVASKPSSMPTSIAARKR